jgi:MerR family transcriptional regulator, light-induced transcriptional regulator
MPPARQTMTAVSADRSYEIHEVAELTGLATPRLRAWERRYEVVRPMRQPNRYRTYSSEQVALLRAFARLCTDGERIGDLVRQPRESVIARAEGRVTDGSPLAQLLEAVKRLDHRRLALLLAEQRGRMDIRRFGREIVLPLGEIIGDLWALGRLSVAAEHGASEVVVGLLKRELSQPPATGPVLLGACLPGEQHEWGFLVTLAGLQTAGWRVHYLGADLPLKDLVDASWTTVPRVVALSGADPGNVASCFPELRRLPRLVPPGTTVVVGGKGAEIGGSRLRRAGLKVGADAMPAVGPAPSGRVASRRT